MGSGPGDGGFEDIGRWAMTEDGWKSLRRVGVEKLV
jgi:hypothetical protein